MDQFTDMIQVEFRNNSTGIWMGLKHGAMRKDGRHEIITDMWHALLSVIRPDSL